MEKVEEEVIGERDGGGSGRIGERRSGGGSIGGLPVVMWYMCLCVIYDRSNSIRVIPRFSRSFCVRYRSLHVFLCHFISICTIRNH